MTESTRPKRVVIVDADNPLEEIHGEFFWREEHERALAGAREVAFRDGYRRGWSDASRGTAQVTWRVRRRTSRLVLRALILLAAIAFGLSLLANLRR